MLKARSVFDSEAELAIGGKMSDFQWSFSVRGAITVMSLYAFVYYFLARAVLASISKQIPRYYDVGDESGNLPVGMAASSAILEMVFDGDMPGRDFGRFVRFGLYAVRVMFVCYAPLAAFLLYEAW